jgi:hypothetical protein
VGFAADASARINGAGRGGRHLRRRGAEHDQFGGGGLCRKVAAGGALGRAGQGRIALRAAAAPPGQDAGFAVPDLQGNHLRPGAPGRRRARAGRHRPRAGQLPAPLGAGLHRDSARHGESCPARRCARSWRPAGGPGCAGRLRGRDPGAPGQRQIAGADGRRRGAPLRAGRQGGAAGAPARPAGGDQLHGPRPAGRPGRAAGGHLHGRGRLSRSDATGGKLGRAVPARRDHLRHQLRRLRDQDRHAQDHPGAQRPRHHRLPHLFRTCRWPRWSMRMLACVRRRQGVGRDAAGLPARPGGR